MSMRLHACATNGAFTPVADGPGAVEVRHPTVLD